MPAVTFVGIPITRPSMTARGVSAAVVSTRWSEVSKPKSDENTVCSLRRRLPSTISSKPGATMRETPSARLPACLVE